MSRFAPAALVWIMNPTNSRWKKVLVRFLPALAAVTVLGSAGGYEAYKYTHADCCHPGSPCCYPGSPCCAGHAAGHPLAMK
jgi:hypothetical protein